MLRSAKLVRKIESLRLDLYHDFGIGKKNPNICIASSKVDIYIHLAGTLVIASLKNALYIQGIARDRFL